MHSRRIKMRLQLILCVWSDCVYSVNCCKSRLICASPYALLFCTFMDIKLLRFSKKLSHALFYLVWFLFSFCSATRIFYMKKNLIHMVSSTVYFSSFSYRDEVFVFFLLFSFSFFLELLWIITHLSCGCIQCDIIKFQFQMFTINWIVCVYTQLKTISYPPISWELCYSIGNIFLKIYVINALQNGNNWFLTLSKNSLFAKFPSNKICSHNAKVEFYWMKRLELSSL